MTGHVRIHVDIDADAYRVLARRTDGEVGRLLRTLATRAAATEPQPIQQEHTVTDLGPRDAKTRRYGRTTRRMAIIRQMLSQGYQVKAIAEHLQISVRAVHEYQSRLASTPPTLEERILGIGGLHRAGYTADEIARALNLNQAEVLAYIEGIRNAS